MFLSLSFILCYMLSLFVRTASEWKKLLQQYELPPCHTCTAKSVALSFGIGNRGSGVQWHTHGPGFSEALHGRKHWILFPPDQKPVFHKDQSSRQWMEYAYWNGNPRLYECTCKCRKRLMVLSIHVERASFCLLSCWDLRLPMRVCARFSRFGTPHTQWTLVTSSTFRIDGGTLQSISIRTRHSCQPLRLNMEWTCTMNFEKK
jgi:hypothetical protein